MSLSLKGAQNVFPFPALMYGCQSQDIAQFAE